MDKPANLTAYLTWLVIIPLLFRTLGPHRAALIAVFGGFLFLPTTDPRLEVGPWTIVVSKLITTGLAPLLGVLLFDRRTLLRARPGWPDLPIAAFVAWPLIGVGIRGLSSLDESLHQSWWNLTVWGVPYLLGRLYFGDAEGTRRIADALVKAGLAYVPICVFETMMGPRWYLLNVFYGVPTSGAFRLGGWRPDGFLSHGLELAAWMALSTVVAFWPWLCRDGGRPWRLPAGVPALILLPTALACRSVYGYLVLGTGLLATLLTQALRTRLVLVALLLISPAYIGLRASGVWSARELDAVAQRSGRGGTVGIRLDAEDRRIEHVRSHVRTLLFGDGTDEWADSWWVVFLGQGGLLGLALFLASFFLVPAAMLSAHFPGRTVRGSPIAPAWGLALFLALHMIDSIHNTSHLTPTTLIGGALTGLCIADRKGRHGDGPANGPTRVGHPRAMSDVIRLVLILASWVVLEVIGHLPRTPHPMDSASPTAPGRDPAPGPHAPPTAGPP
jgi:hypothetical protein